jgi:hypothetical protein
MTKIEKKKYSLIQWNITWETEQQERDAQKIVEIFYEMPVKDKP